MCEILLSINPEHVENIFNGTKGFEFRKIRCKRSIDKIIIYSTSPVMQVVGEARVSQILEGPPDDIWNRTKDRAGIDSSYFTSYFEDRLRAFAYELKEIVRYEEPKDLAEFGLTMPPQSFVYIRNDPS